MRETFETRKSQAVRGPIRLGLLWLAAALLLPASAGAVTIDPIWFLGGGQFGLVGTPSPQWLADDTASFYGAGADSSNPLVISQNLQLPALSNPQAAYVNPLAGCNPGAGDVCQSPTNPFVADSIWTVTNNSGQVLDDVKLAFAMVDLSEGYPNLPVALDQEVIEILKYTSGGTDYYFGMVSLGSLAIGQSAVFTFRYIVGDDMPLETPTGGEPVDALQILPPIGTFGIVGATYVPEPGTALLLATGLVGLALAKRYRA